MPPLAHRQRRNVFALSGGAAAVVLTGQVLLQTFFSSSSFDHDRALRPLVESTPPMRAAGLMDAAVSTGQFEELVRPTPVPTVAPMPAVAPEQALAPEPPVFESGVASTYGEDDGFEGNLTACGEVFHTQVVQVAHKSLPCGTTVRIEDTNTGRSVIAEVTDRGPYIAGRIVDLSWGAFEQLDPSGPGLLDVKVYVLDQ